MYTMLKGQKTKNLEETASQSELAVAQTIPMITKFCPATETAYRIQGRFVLLLNFQNIRI